MKTIFLLAFVGLVLAEPEGATRDASSDSKRSQSNGQGHFVPAHDRPSTVVIKYSIPNHRARTAGSQSQSQVSVTRTQHPGFSGGPPRFRNAPSAEDEEAKEARKEETLLKSDSSLFTRTKKPVPVEMDDDFPKPEKKVRTKSKDDDSIATLKDFGKKPFDDISFSTGGDDSVTSTKSTDTKSVKDETESGKGPAFRVFPYVLIGRTTSGTEFPFLAMLRESQQNSNVASEKPFIPAFVAMNPEDPASQLTHSQAAVPDIAPFPSPSLHPELLRAIPEPPKLTPSPEEFLRTAEHPSDERPRLVAAPIFNLPLPPMESLVRENIMSAHPSNFIRGREPEMPFNDMHLREMPRRPRFLPEFERQPMFERPPPMFEREPMFVRPRFFPEPPLPMRHM